MKGGSLLGGGRSSSKIVAKLEKSSDSYRWAAATTGSQQAAGYQLASQKPVMAIGGFNGSDPYPSLEQFKQYVKDKQIHYYIAGEMGGHQMGVQTLPRKSHSGWPSTIPQTRLMASPFMI